MTNPRKEAPFVRASFINAIREEGTKEEACDFLQKTWNEKCALQARVEEQDEWIKRFSDTAKRDAETAHKLGRLQGLLDAADWIDENRISCRSAAVNGLRKKAEQEQSQ